MSTWLRAAYRKGRTDARAMRASRNPYTSEPGDRTIERGEWMAYNTGYNSHYRGMRVDQMELLRDMY